MLFKMAKEKLGDGDFSQIASAVPGMEEMIGAAPESGGMAKAMGSLTSGLGGKLGQMGSLAGVASGFSKLGLEKDMIGKFVPTILSFVQSKGGDSVKSLLANVMK